MVRAFIQAAAGSRRRLVCDERALVTLGVRELPLPHPFPYGFVVDTTAPDGDALDCYVITARPLVPGQIVACQLAGLVGQREGDEADLKLLVVLPDEAVTVDDTTRATLEAFIVATFAALGGPPVALGPLEPAAAAAALLAGATPSRRA